LAKRGEERWDREIRPDAVMGNPFARCQCTQKESGTEKERISEKEKSKEQPLSRRRPIEGGSRGDGQVGGGGDEF